MQWTDSSNDFFATSTSCKSSSSSSISAAGSITSTLKDYRPPKLQASEVASSSVSKTAPATSTAAAATVISKVGTSSRYATTIYKCQVCTKAFASTAFLEEHMKVHNKAISVQDAVKLSTTMTTSVSVNNNFSKNTNEHAGKRRHEHLVECSSCRKPFPDKEALISHFKVSFDQQNI